MRSKLFVVFAFLLVASMVLGACAQPTPAPTAAPAEEKPPVVQTVIVEKEGATQVVVITATPEPTTPPPAGPKKVRLNLGPGDVPTIDPALSTDTSSVQIVDLTSVGVTRQDEVTNELGPGMANDWDISEDGTVYTFHLRNDVPWVEWDAVSGQVATVKDCEGNDRMVKAQDFAYGILRTLKPETASDYAYVLAFAVKGATEFNAGDSTDPETVGVKAVDDYTLEVTFNDAAAYNAAIIGMWIAHAQPTWIIDGDDCTEARGDRWTETGFYQSYGPFVMKEWVHDSLITLVKNPFWPGTEFTPQPKLDEVTYVMLDEVPAFAEYEAGNLDAAAVPLADIDRVKADPTLSAELKIAPNLCTYYYGFNSKAPIVDNVHVRRALSMALDRQSLIDNVTKGGQQPAQWFSRPGIAAAPTMETHPDLGIKYDPAAAKAELDAYFAETGKTLADIQNQITLMFNTSSGHQKIAEAIQQMWKDNLGLEVQLTNQEWKVYLDTIKSADTPQIWRLGWCIDYPDANNFVREVFGYGGSANPPDGGVNWKNDTFEQLIMDAAKELDPAKRLDLYAQAEQILVYEDAVMIPIYWYTRVTVTKPYVTRTFSSGGHEALEKWDISK